MLERKYFYTFQKGNWFKKAGRNEGSRHLVVVLEVFRFVDRDGLFLSIDEDFDGGGRRRVLISA